MMAAGRHNGGEDIAERWNMLILTVWVLLEDDMTKKPGGISFLESSCSIINLHKV